MTDSQGRIPQDKIDEVRLNADIVAVVGSRVRLTKKGKDYWGLCPFHGDSDPSFKVDRERGTWYCFGCGEGGSVFNFVMRDQGLTFPEAVREIAGRFGVELPKRKLTPEEEKQRTRREKLYQILIKAQEYFQNQLSSPQGRPVLEYMANQRGLSPQIIHEFGLGFAPETWEGLGRYLAASGVDESLAADAGLVVKRDSGRGAYDRFRGRLTIPIKNLSGRIISFGGRALGEVEPKYLNGPESELFKKSQALYNLDRAAAHIRRSGQVLVMEGYFDVIACAANGFENAVAPMGTSLTQPQALRLRRMAGEALLVFDGDEAGRKAATRALPIFQEAGMEARAVILPQGEDPDSLVRGQGAEALKSLLQGARPLVEMVLDRVISLGDRTTPEGASRIIAEAGGVIKSISDPVVRWLYLERLASKLSLAPELAAAKLGLPLPGARKTAPAPRRSADGLAWDEESCILELALCCPESARVFMEAGILGSLKEPRLSMVGVTIQEILEQGREPTAEAVISALTDQSVSGLVAGLVENGPKMDPPKAEQMARRHAEVWLRRNIKGRRRAMRLAMDAAYRAGDARTVARYQQARQGQMVVTSGPFKVGKD